MNSRSLGSDPADRMMLSSITPTFQQLARDGVMVSHLDRIRQDRRYAKRIARALKTGGWQLTPSEMAAFDLLGEEAMYVSPEVTEMWSIAEYYGDHQDWDKRDVHYNPEILREVISKQRARLVNSASSGVASTEPETDWRLFYITGATLQALIEKMFQFHLPGLDREKLRAFLRAWPSSAFESVKPGYYLINVSPVKDYKWCNTDRRKAVPPLIMLEAHITHYLLRGQWGFVDRNWGVCAFMEIPTDHPKALVELWRNKPVPKEPSVSFGIDYFPKGPQTMGTMAMIEPAFPVVV